MIRLVLVLFVSVSFFIQIQAGPVGRWSKSGLEHQLASVFKKVSGRVPAVSESVNDLTKKNEDINFRFESIQNALLKVQTKIATLHYLSSGQAVQSGKLKLNEQKAVGMVKAFPRASQNVTAEFTEPLSLSPVKMDDVLSSLLINSLRRNSTFLAAHWILRGATAQSKDLLTGLTALQMAIVHQLRAVTQMLLETADGCCVDVRDQNSNGLLHLIARHGGKSDWSNVGRMLIQLGVAVDSVNDQGQTALHVAVSSQNLHFARFLIHTGASMEAANSNGSTSLHLAVHQVEMMRLLLESGANYESRDCYLQTPLHVAAIKGQYRVANMLVFYRARAHVVDLFSKTPLDYAVKLHPHDEISGMLNYYSRKDDRREQVKPSAPSNCTSFVTVYDLTV